MDHTIPTPWNAERYYRIEQEVRHYLVTQCQFAEHHIRCIPVSGLSGENLVSMSEDCPGKSWYGGLTLQQGLDGFQLPHRLVDHAFRAMINTPILKTHHAHNSEYDLEITIVQGKVCLHRTLGLVSYSTGHCHTEAVVVTQIKRLNNESGLLEENLTVAYAREKVILRIAPK